MEEYSLETYKQALNNAEYENRACRLLIKQLLREQQKLQRQIEKLQRKQGLIRAEARRWKQEYKRISETLAVRLDMIDDLCDEIQRLDKIVYHKPF